MYLFLLPACVDWVSDPKSSSPATGDDAVAEDLDGDGYAADDCDDGDDAVHPDAEETCNERDDDCDGDMDEGVDNLYYRDADGDAYGTSATTSRGCVAPSGYVDNDDDCDDASALISPDAVEACDEADNDCDGTVDEGVTVTYYVDADGDEHGSDEQTKEACSVPTGYATEADDCDDSAANVHPGAVETCNSDDDDCDGSTDEGVTTTYYRDSDGDAYGSSSSTTACSTPSGYVGNDDDCDDGASSVHPGATETCNSDDDDCDGSTDEGVTTTYYEDSDGDGYGVSSSTAAACSLPSGYAYVPDDCDDSDDAMAPGAPEVCGDGADQDCDGETDGSGEFCDDDLGCTESAGCSIRRDGCMCACDDGSTVYWEVQSACADMYDCPLGQAVYSIVSSTGSSGDVSCADELTALPSGVWPGSGDPAVSVSLTATIPCDGADVLETWESGGSSDLRAVSLLVKDSGGSEIYRWSSYGAYISATSKSLPCTGTVDITVKGSFEWS